MQNSECKVMPLVSILLAVYKPNEVWLKEQLSSLNEQTYSNIELLIWHDCIEEPFNESLLNECITNFTYTLYTGESHIGSTKVFEELTKLGNGEYFVYCDQDDIWNANKIARMVSVLESTNSNLVCSDAYIINEDSKKIANSVKEVHKRHKFYSGSHITERLIINNFVAGCMMIIKAPIAKKAVPFCNYTIHDGWLAIMASLDGRIESIPDLLIGYRKHYSNQTGILHNIYDKKTYYNIRLIQFSKQIEELSVRLKERKELSSFFTSYQNWISARIGYFEKPNFYDFKIMFTYKRFGVHQILFEIASHLMAEKIFNWVVILLQRGKI